MTRINTNVNSLIAQSRLDRTNNQLQTAMTRLSTGLRINSGKDDPAGLIASEALRSDITAINKALSNTQRANQIIATADSALGQVANLLNDVRGLVTEAANGGALSDEEIAANQLQIDSSLEAINRIAQTTSFQGKRLLDGSLDFVSNAASVSTLRDVRIDQANLGSTGAVKVDVDISAAATRGEITTDSAAVSTAAQATATLKFAPEAILTGFTDAGTSILVRAKDNKEEYDGVTVQFSAGSTAVGSETATYDKDAKTITVNINNAAATTAANVVAAINTLAEFEGVVVGAGAVDGSDSGDVAITDTTDTDEIAITAQTAGADFNGVGVRVVKDSATATGSPTAAYDAENKEIVVTVNDTGTTTIANIATAINNLAEFNAAATANGDGSIIGTSSADTEATTNTNNSGGGVLLADLVVEIGGREGTEVFNFKTGASVNQIADAVKLLSDSTGVTAVQSGQTVTFRSTTYGSKGLVTTNVISEGLAGKFKDNLSSNRALGTDIAATINGVTATADGNKFSINTAALDVTLTVDDGSAKGFEFTISGGGALFQLGGDVVSNQQARIGISSISTARLGGVSGKLYELASGGSKTLKNDSTGASKVVDEVIEKVASLRGRLGAFQRTTLESNTVALTDTVANLTEAESSIRDADFARESSALTRAQILVQSGTSVLGIANQNPQNVLSLLR
jgi:flagellin